MGIQLGSVTGTVAAPPEAVWRALVEILPELAGLDRTMLVRLEEPRTFTVPIGEPPIGTAAVDVDPARCEVSQKGQWWYQGVVTVTPHTEGSTVTRTINNVAPGWTRWLVAFVQRHDARLLRLQHAALLRALGDQLGCRVSVVAPRESALNGRTGFPHVIRLGRPAVSFTRIADW